MKRNCIAWLLSVVLAVSLLVLPASAEDAVLDSGPQKQTTQEADPHQMNNDELFAHYVEQVFQAEQPGQKPSRLGNTGYQALDNGEKRLYKGLRPGITRLANGSAEYAQVTIRLYDYGWDRYNYIDHIDRVLQAMMSDMPYDFYWYDKTHGFRCQGTEDALTLSLYVAAAYSASGSVGSYQLDTNKTGAASRSAANAKQVVAKYKDLNDIAKLRAYKNYICQQVEYCDQALEDPYMPYGDPWQLIYVFDNNPNTNVVCEGYSKAFQYLCDSSFFHARISCSYVTSDYHMWNLVTRNGRSFFVDVTNCDSGTVGSGLGPDGRANRNSVCGDSLFLVNTSGMLLDDGTYSDAVTAYGSVDSGYQFYIADGNHMEYLYDQDTLNLLGSSGILDLSTINHQPDPEPPADPIGRHSRWATETLYDALNRGLIPDRLFYQDMTQFTRRDEFAAVGVKLYEDLSGKPAPLPQRNPFRDTNDPDVLKAYALGLVNGVSADRFAPTHLLTREQAATMLTRAYKAAAEPSWTLETDYRYSLVFDMPPLFRDDKQISGWARESVYFMTAYNIINGIGNNTFAPRHNASREQSIAISLRTAQNLALR